MLVVKLVGSGSCDIINKHLFYDLLYAREFANDFAHIISFKFYNNFQIDSTSVLKMWINESETC